MAIYRPRSDGLVDLEVAPGLALPMSEEQAQQGGHTPGPPLNFGPNPYSMIGSGEATAQLARNTATAMSDAAAAPKPADDLGPTPRDYSSPEEQAAAAEGRAKIWEGLKSKVSDFFSRSGAPDDPLATRRKYRGEPDPVPEAPATEGKGAEAPKPKPAPAPERSAPYQPEGGYQLDQPVRVTGGGMTPYEATTKSGIKLDPAYKKLVNASSPEAERDEYRAGAQKIYDEQQRALETERIENERQQIENAERKEQLAVRRGILQERLNTIDQREKEAASATPQSRDQILGSRSTLARVLSGLSIAMGARYQGLTGRNNPGLDLLNQAVADEIAAQRMKYEAAKDKVAMANTDFGKAMQLYGDPNVAEADLYNRAYTLAANIAKNHWKSAESESDLLNRKTVSDELLKKAADWKQNAYAMTQAQTVNTSRREDAKVEGLLTDDQRERQVHVPGYGYGFVTNKAAATAVQDQLTAAGTALDIFAELKALQKNGQFVNDLDTRSRLKALKARALPAISAAEKQGVVTEADAKNAREVLNNENAFFSSGVAALEATELAMRLTLDGIVKNRIYQDPYARIPMRAKRDNSFQPGLP